MKLIQDLSELATPNLTDNQKGILISIYTSATPQQAYDSSLGSNASVVAKNELLRLGLIIQDNNQLVLSQMGQNAVYSNNLIDDTGKITDEGQKQLDAFENNKQEQINLEAFDMIKSFYQQNPKI